MRELPMIDKKPLLSLEAPAGAAPGDDDVDLASLFAPPAPAKGSPGSLAPTADERALAEQRAAVERVLAELRPFIQADGGDIALDSVVDGVVRVRMSGACVGCASSSYTLQLGVERKLKEMVPGIRAVEAV